MNYWRWARDVHNTEIVDSIDYRERDEPITFLENDFNYRLPLWFDEPEEEEWLEAWRALPWLET